MALAGHKLDLYVMGASALRDHTDCMTSLLSELEVSGLVDAQGAPCASEEFVIGGVARLRVDVQPHPRFYSNTKGGFRAFCTACQHNVTGAFASEITRWRESGRATDAMATAVIQCPQCGETQPLLEVSCRPRAAFAHGALVLHDVASTQTTPSFDRFLHVHLPGYRVVSSRA